MGLHRAGFDVVGIDIKPQPRYPFRFIQADGLNPPVNLADFDFIWASPPCQAYTGMQRLNTRAPKRDHPKLVEPVRDMLRAASIPFAIENVPGAPLIDPIMLCGSMFGLNVRRHRLFECSFWMLRPPCRHDLEIHPVPVWGDGRPTRQEVRRARRSPIAVYGDHPQTPGDKTARVNRARTLREGQDAMGIDWMDWRPLTQAIPPAYAEFIGRAALATLTTRRDQLLQEPRSNRSDVNEPLHADHKSGESFHDHRKVFRVPDAAKAGAGGP